METSSNLPDPAPELPVAPKRRRRWWKVLLVVVAALLLLAALAPYAISLGFVRERIAAAASRQLNGRVHLGGLSWSWLGGVTVRDLRVDNPEGFPTERPAVSARSMLADVSVGSLFGGATSATAVIEGLVVHVEQRADGSSNLQALLKPSPTARDDAPGAPRPGSGDARGRGSFDVELIDCAVHVRREGELLEQLTDLKLRARSSSDSADILVEASGKLRAGDLAVDARVDPITDRSHAKLVTHGLDLASWQPLLDALRPGEITALAGRLDGEITADVHGSDRVELGGALTVVAPRLAGPILRGMDLRSERWTITPALSIGDGAKSVDATAFAVDLGWLQLRGVPGAAPDTLTLACELDVARLAEFGGPVPASLRGTAAKLTGQLRLPTADLPADAAGWAKAIGADAKLLVPQLDVAGFALRGVDLDATLAGGRLDVKTAPSTLLDGGALALRADVGLGDFARMPTHASLQWNGGALTGGATQALRYAMPLFAGLDADVASLVGKIDLDLSFDGPAMKQEDQTWFSWLNDWSGSGTLGLADAAFAPSEQLRGLLAPLGPLSKGAVPVAQDGRLKVDSFRAPFSFAKGVVQAKASEWMAAGEKIGMSGSIAFDGNVDYALDLSALLKGHKDGQKVLQALGGSLPAARMTGTLDAPALGLPKLENIATKLLEQEGRNLLEKGLEELFGRKKKQGGGE